MYSPDEEWMTNIRVTDANGDERMENYVVRYSFVRGFRLGVTGAITTHILDAF